MKRERLYINKNSNFDYCIETRINYIALIPLIIFGLLFIGVIIVFIFLLFH